MHVFLSNFAQTWGLLFAMTLFAVMVGYALWPRNQSRFNRAARAPLEEHDKPLMTAEE